MIPSKKIKQLVGCFHIFLTPGVARALAWSIPHPPSPELHLNQRGESGKGGVSFR